MNKNDGIIIRLEKEEEYRKTEELVREAFWNVYREGAVEHYVLHLMRNDPDYVKELGFVMEKDGELVGQIAYVKSYVDAECGRIPVLTFGPISILPKYQRQGLGKMLLDYSMDVAGKLGFGAIFITGNIEFYKTCGFMISKTLGIRYFDDVSADYFLARELKKGFLSGVVGTYKDPKIYFVADKNKEELEKFDGSFPEKEKKKSNDQIF